MEPEKIKQRVIDRVDAIQDQLWGIAKALYTLSRTSISRIQIGCLAYRYIGTSRF